MGPNVLSLFAGVGGLDLGIERALGAATVAYSEIEEHPREVLAARFPDAADLGDVTDLTFERNDNGTTYIERGSDGEGWWLPPINIIAAGFPCQDISLNGKGAGLAGERSGLWREVARAVRDLRPGLVIVENVRALLARGADTVLGDLAALGYDAEWHVVSAAAAGAPHRRERLFIIAYLADSASE